MTESFPPPPPPTSSTLPGPRAGFGERLVAAIIDAVILWVVDLVLYAALRVVGSGLGLLVGLGYYAFFEGGPAGQTIGKRVMNIRVVRADGSGQELGWATALIRYVCRIISGLACLLGYLWMLWDRDQMTWHDKLSQTVVVPTSAYPVPAGAFGKAPGSSPV
jgi:uncharacterized RDD family membrane protein YckC